MCKFHFSTWAAIRKRSCESASAALSGAKRLNSLVNGIETLRNDSMKKTKMSTVRSIWYRMYTHINITCPYLFD